MWGDGRIKKKPVGCRQLHLKAKTTRKKWKEDTPKRLDSSNERQTEYGGTFCFSFILVPDKIKKAKRQDDDIFVSFGAD